MKKLIILFLLAFTVVNAQIGIDGEIKKEISLWKLANGDLSPISSTWSLSGIANLTLNGYGVMDTIYGSTASGGNLFLSSTSHATKGLIYLGANSVYDQVNDRLSIGATSPGAKLDVVPSSSSDIVFRTKSLQSTAPLGSELVGNGAFADSSVWVFGTGWSHDATNLEADHTAGNTAALTQSISVTSGLTYQVEITIKNITAGSVTLNINGVYIYNYGSITALSSNTTYKRSLVANITGSATLSITPTTDFDGSIDDITVKQITGVSQPNFALLDDAGAVMAEIRGKNFLGNIALGTSALYSNSTGTNNSAMGTSALYSNSTGSYNLAMGVYALYSNSTGSSNSAMGYRALYSNSTGTSNSAMGVYALYFNSTGSSNSAMGVNALYSNSTGSSNSAMGYAALYSNSTGSSNSAMGYNALGSNSAGSSNSAMGYNALGSNSTGSYNLAMGVNALYSNSTGSSNSAMGYNAGRYITGSASNQTSNTSIYLGAETKAYADGDANEIVIGYNTTGFGSNTATYGNSSMTKHIFQAGNVIISTGGLFPRYLTGSLTDGAPLDAEIDAITSSTPAGLGAGYMFLIKDSDGTGLIYQVISDGTNWQYTAMVKAL